MESDLATIVSHPGIAEFVIICGCLVANAIFSAADTAIVTFGPMKTRQLLDEKESPGTYLKYWLEHPERINATIIIINTFSIALLATLLTRMAIHFNLTSIVTLSTAAATLMILILGKVVPKSWARAKHERLAPASMRLLFYIQFFLYPFVALFSLAADLLFKAAGGTPGKGSSITEEDLEFLVNEGEKAGFLEETKKEMLVSVFDFGETKVREIMTPRTDILALSSDESIEDAIRTASENGHSRLPVYNESIDQIVGILLVKDLLPSTLKISPGASLNKLLRQPFFVPESKLIMDVFKDLKRTKNHMAIVIDEYGGTAGIVTMEDILEELVGEIQDEHDTEEAKISEIEPGICDVIGSINIDEFLEYFGLDREETLGPDAQDADTIAGYMTQMLGNLPEAGATLRIGPLNVEIVEVKRHRIHKVRVARIIARGDDPG